MEENKQVENMPAENVSVENKLVESVDRKVIKIPRKTLWWVSSAVIVLILIVLVLSSFSGSRNKGMSVSSRGDFMTGTPSVSDTREFMKVSYDSTLKTRDVEGVTTQVKNIVKGADGRIDSLNVSQKYGRVSFVVAKSKFDAFKKEMESVVNKKLYIDNIASQNLLDEKKNIEEEISLATKELNTKIAERDQFLKDHSKLINDLSKSLYDANVGLVRLRATIAGEKNQQTLVELRKQETILVEQKALAKQKLDEENIGYASKNVQYDQRVNEANDALNLVKMKDDKFTDNVETVNGYVAISWISLWRMAVIFSPVHPIIIIITLIIIVGFLFRKKMPMFQII